jgi:hypothetical protein
MSLRLIGFKIKSTNNLEVKKIIQTFAPRYNESVRKERGKVEVVRLLRNKNFKNN